MLFLTATRIPGTFNIPAMKKIIVIFFCLSCFQLMAQKPKADKKFMLYEYSEAIPLYESYLVNNPSDYDASKKLALSYKYTNNINGAIETYKSMINLKEAVPLDLYDLAQLLRMKGDLVDAEKYALQYQSRQDGEKAQNLLQAIRRHDELMATINDYNIENKTGLYLQSVFASSPYGTGFIVTSESQSQEISLWTGRGYTKLYYADVDFFTLTPFAAEIMSDYDDGIATFSSDGKTMYYTSVNELSLKETDINTRMLQISSATLENDKWQLADLFPYKNNSYNMAHPALSKSGKILVFSSNKPGGRGGMDLYYCLIQTDNTWSEPVNISQLNTEENEVFPVFDSKGNLYFSSNGLPGLGGLDIFYSEFSGEKFLSPVNVKAPLNSNYDDFQLVTFNDLENGYISTNRFDSPETDDIAYFSRKIKETPVAASVIIKINVIDKYTSIPLPYVLVSIKDSKGNIIHNGLTDPQGVLLVEDLPGDNYQVQGVLNEITTTIAQISKDEFTGVLIEKTVTHNDPRFTLSGLVVNTVNGQPVNEVSVTCKNLTNNKSSVVTTSSDGKFFFQLEQASDFKVTGEKAGWLSSEAAYETTKGMDRSKELYVILRLNMQRPVGDAVIKLDKIYYDYDKCNINPRAAEELNRLVKLMNDYPDMVIELSSHTDCRGSFAYNEKLSQCRADAAVSYILSKGIDKSRIVARGYGESKLVNECADGVNCSEEKHQENRRTEFKILKCPSCPEIEN
jgi:outer membrane protein OmpA-like peptidoglycan-associated protein